MSSASIRTSTVITLTLSLEEAKSLRHFLQFGTFEDEEQHCAPFDMEMHSELHQTLSRIVVRA